MHCLQFWAQCTCSTAFLQFHSADGRNRPIIALILELVAPKPGNIAHAHNVCRVPRENVEEVLRSTVHFCLSYYAFDDDTTLCHFITDDGKLGIKHLYAPSMQ
jgi:hypothetical protein